MAPILFLKSDCEGDAELHSEAACRRMVCLPVRMPGACVLMIGKLGWAKLGCGVGGRPRSCWCGGKRRAGNPPVRVGIMMCLYKL
jgi:hypothetical protein